MVPELLKRVNQGANQRIGCWLSLSLAVMLAPTATNVMGFALIGPYANWMDLTNSYRMGWDVAGPVDITEGYRWNVPVVTYGFDQSFIEYFGSNGVYAVEQAFQVFNDLPPASDIVLTNYATECQGYNYQAAALHLYDLRTATAALLIEQLGLAEAERSQFVLRKWSPVFLTQNSEMDWPGWVIPDYIVERNYDPELLAVSHHVNNNLFTAQVAIIGPLDPDPQLAFALPFLIDPLDIYASAAADLRQYFRPILDDYSRAFGIFAGGVLLGLTQDDVGGLRYLLSTNRVSPEILLSDVRGPGSNALSYVNLASRPGLEKITFVRQPHDSVSGAFLPYTNQWTDTFFTNGVAEHQQLERVTTRPDFLFSAVDAGWTNSSAPFFVRSGAEYWWNSAAGLDGLGPGVIRPQVEIAFNKFGPCVETYEDSSQNGDVRVFDLHWASFDRSTNPIVVYPQAPITGPTNQLIIHQWFFDANAANFWNYYGISWMAPIPIGSQAVLQTSTNLSDWVSLETNVNQGTPVTWRHFYSLPQRYFRVIGR